jgi:hypothetical protein
VILDEIRRFRLGLYTMRERDEGTFDIREEIEPPRTDDAEPEDVNALIDTFLGSDTELRNEYRRWMRGQLERKAQRTNIVRRPGYRFDPPVITRPPIASATSRSDRRSRRSTSCVTAFASRGAPAAL